MTMSIEKITDVFSEEEIERLEITQEDYDQTMEELRVGADIIDSHMEAATYAAEAYGLDPHTFIQLLTTRILVASLQTIGFEAVEMAVDSAKHVVRKHINKEQH